MMITAKQARERSLEALLEQREIQFKEITKGIEANQQRVSIIIMEMGCSILRIEQR